METVRQILQAKGYQIFSVSPDAKVFEALHLMAEKGVGALLVVSGEKVEGIMSERDYARKVVLLGKSSREASVKEIMSSKVIYVEPHQSVTECMALMIDKKIRHLPVFENDKLTGLISIGDVVKAVIGEQEFVIDQLTHYIVGVPKTSEV